jgi:hypothetical protein
MYKKLVTFLVFSLYAPLAAFSADDPSRARLYIPVSTNVTFEDCTTCEGKASGYAARYVFGFGLGLGVASSKLAISGDPDIADYSLDTGPMMDIGYTFGSDFTFTFGLGVGSSPTSDKFIPDINYKIEGKSASTSFLGLGYSFGSIEILLALRSSSASFDESYMMSFFGREMMTSWANEYEWQTTDIGIGFTF